MIPYDLILCLDIGGSLCKYQLYLKTTEKLPHLYGIHSTETVLEKLVELNEMMDNITRHNPAGADASKSIVTTTGGGSIKFKDQIECIFGSKNLRFFDEMECISRGAIKMTSMEGPFVLTNVGSGVSMVRIQSPTDFKRITGSCIGGGTFLGLSKHILQNRSIDFDQVINIASNGDHGKSDLLVGDIYGNDYPGICNLKADVIASSFGKNTTIGLPTGDSLSSQLHMIIANIVHISGLCSRSGEKLPVVFSGAFLSHVSVRMIFTHYCKYLEIDGSFVDSPQFVGCVGALAIIEDNLEK